MARTTYSHLMDKEIESVRGKVPGVTLLTHFLSTMLSTFNNFL